MKRIFKIISKDVRANAAKAVMECTSDPIMQVTIEPYVEDKTAEQRGWFHILCRILGEQSGYSEGEIKEYVKKDILGTKLININGVQREVAESSEAQNKIGYSELIEGIYRIAAEAGIVLPLPRFNI